MPGKPRLLQLRIASNEIMDQLSDKIKKSMTPSESDSDEKSGSPSNQSQIEAYSTVQNILKFTLLDMFNMNLTKHSGQYKPVPLQNQTKDAMERINAKIDGLIQIHSMKAGNGEQNESTKEYIEALEESKKIISASVSKATVKTPKTNVKTAATKR